MKTCTTTLLLLFVAQVVEGAKPNGAISLRGGGIFSQLRSKASSESEKLKEKAKQATAELTNSKESLKAEAKRRAEEELAQMDKEARRMADEYEKAARAKATELEKVARAKGSEYQAMARTKATEYETLARQAALKVASEWEKTARRKAVEYETAFKRKMGEVEKESMKRASIMERGYKKKAAKAMGYQITVLDEAVARYFFVSIVTIMTVSSLTNLIGWPQLITDHWKVYGEKFFPFSGLDVVQKRLLAGGLELLGIGMMQYDKSRKFGTALIAAMLTWASIVNAQLNLYKMALSMFVAVLSWALLANEVIV